jgi:hypothetical protein
MPVGRAKAFPSLAIFALQVGEALPQSFFQIILNLPEDSRNVPDVKPHLQSARGKPAGSHPRSALAARDREKLAQLDHLRMFFGFFAILFLVKLCVSFAAVRKNG